MTTASEVLRDGFARHIWATVVLIDHLEELGRTDLDASIPGTYGTISLTLGHLVDADDRYLQRLDGGQIPPYVDHGTQPLALLRERVQQHEARWTTMLDRLDAGDLVAPVGGQAHDYPEFAHGESLLLLQALHHGDDHRAQVCSTLGALGLDVPELDVWSFWPAERSG